jgi:hypothetical protein
MSVLPLHSARMEIARPADPARLVEAHNIDYERVASPDALQIRLAPWSLQFRLAGRDRRPSLQDDRERRDHNGREHTGEQKPSAVLAHGKRLMVLRIAIQARDFRNRSTDAIPGYHR